MIFNFQDGNTAERINKMMKSLIKQNSNYYFEPIIGINYNRIKTIDNRFFYLKSDEEYQMMFAYKNEYNTSQFGLPKFHICECKTREEYSGFKFAASMPVDIYCRDTRKQLTEPQFLELCKNCIAKSQKGLFSFLAKGKPWFEYVLEFACSNNELAIKKRRDGYVVLWKNISEAVRERDNFKCELCNIELSKYKYFLEVHHKDYNKINNRGENLQSLCVLCHATIDSLHLNNFKRNSYKVNTFINEFKDFIQSNNKAKFDQWIR